MLVGQTSVASPSSAAGRRSRGRVLKHPRDFNLVRELMAKRWQVTAKPRTAGYESHRRAARAARARVPDGSSDAEAGNSTPITDGASACCWHRRTGTCPRASGVAYLDFGKVAAWIS